MSDKWISVTDAISKLEGVGPTGRQEATERMAELAKEGVIASRIAAIVECNGTPPREDVPMTPWHWDAIFDLQSGEWFRFGSASFPNDTQWLGIEINERHLLVYLDSITVKSSWSGPFSSKPAARSKGERHRPGPKPDPDWPAAVAKVTNECIAAGYKRPLSRGDKAAIQTMLLEFMAERSKDFSEDSARRYAAEVIAGLPDN